MRSRGVSVRLTSIEEVQASLQIFGGRIAAMLDEQLGSLGLPEDGSMPFAYQQVFNQLDAKLESVRVRLVEAEDEHVRQRALTANLQRESERQSSELYRKQVAVRRSLDGAFGPEYVFQLAAISGPTPTARKALEEQVDQTVKLLRDPVADAPELQLEDGVDIHFDRLAVALESRRAAHHSARSELLRARKARAATMLDKNAAMAAADRIFPAIASSLEGYFRLVGEVELADRIRTSSRRVTRNQGAEDEEAPVDAAPSEDAAPADGESASPPAEAASEPQAAESAPTETVEPASFLDGS